MTPTYAIEHTDNMLGKLNQIVSAIRCETESNAEEWAMLGQMGAQRDDHAAMLLARLRPALSELSRVAATMEKQIDTMVADPFGRKATA